MLYYEILILLDNLGNVYKMKRMLAHIGPHPFQFYFLNLCSEKNFLRGNLC